MKVKEIIEALKDANPEADVSFAMRSGCCSDMEYLDVKDLYVELAKNHPYKEQYKIKDGDDLVQFYFDSVRGYETCRLAGETVERAREYREKYGKKT